MIRTYTLGNSTWIDLNHPTLEEVRKVVADYNISNIVGEELLSPTLRSRVDIFDNYTYFILHMPSVMSKTKIQEIDFVLGKDFIITTRYEEIDPLLEFSKAIEVDSILKRDNLGDHAGYVFFYMMEHLYDSLLDKLDTIGGDVQHIEASIFKGEERNMVAAISKQARILLNFKIATDMHEEMLASLEKSAKKIFGSDFSHHLERIIGDCKKVRQSILSKRDYLNELRLTNDSLLNSKQNEIMKIFTILAFITFPITIIIDILGIPSEYNPILGNTHDFWIIISIVVVMIISMFVYFKKKLWL
jgi:magnesium transporter